MSRLFQIFTFIILIISLVSIYSLLRGFVPSGYEHVEKVIELAQKMNIKNLVTVVYLGPRIFDTMLEVLVVVLTVIGIKTIKE